MHRVILSAFAVASFLLSGIVRSQELTLETAPPVVVKTSPESGSADVDPGTKEIRVKFSQAMQDGNWSWATASKETFPQTTGMPSYLQDHRTCVLPVKLEPGKIYALWLNSQRFHNFRATNGQAAVPYLLVFRTKA